MRERIQARSERIAHFETLLRMLQRLVLSGARSAQAQRVARACADALAAYYGSADWRADFAADEAGLLPPGLRRGVLSEDGIYNALDAYREWRDALQSPLRDGIVKN